MRYDGREDAERARGTPRVPSWAEGGKRDEAAEEGGGTAIPSCDGWRSMLDKLVEAFVRGLFSAGGRESTHRVMLFVLCMSGRKSMLSWRARGCRRLGVASGSAWRGVSSTRGPSWRSLTARGPHQVSASRSRAQTAERSKRTEGEDLEPSALQAVGPLLAVGLVRSLLLFVLRVVRGPPG